MMDIEIFRMGLVGVHRDHQEFVMLFKEEIVNVVIHADTRTKVVEMGLQGLEDLAENFKPVEHAFMETHANLAMKLTLLLLKLVINFNSWLMV
jgi:hypothetical protein